MLANAILIVGFFAFLMLLMGFAAEETEDTGKDFIDRLIETWRYATTEDDEE